MGNIVVRVPDELHAAVRSRADRQHVSVSAVLRDFLENWVQAGGEVLGIPPSRDAHLLPTKAELQTMNKARPKIIDSPPKEPDLIDVDPADFIEVKPCDHPKGARIMRGSIASCGKCGAIRKANGTWP